MKPRITEAQIMGTLNKAEAGESVKDPCCKKEGANQSETRCAQLEEENRRLKLLVADLTLRNEALKRVVSKKW